MDKLDLGFYRALAISCVSAGNVKRTLYGVITRDERGQGQLTQSAHCSGSIGSLQAAQSLELDPLHKALQGSQGQHPASAESYAQPLAGGT